MKKLLTLALFLFSLSAIGQTIRVNVTGNDPITGKKVKADLIYITFNQDGGVRNIGYMVSYFENNNITPAISAGSSERQKKSVQSVEKEFAVSGKSILSTTLVYSPLVDENNVPIPNAILVSEYLRLNPINQFPGVSNSDPLWKLVEGILKKIIDIELANGGIL
jgi:hypothetical protein